MGSSPTLHEDKSNLIMSSAGDKSEQPKANSVQEFSTDLLRVYYGRLFPYDALFNWLSYGTQAGSDTGNSDFFSRREWSFTIEDDIYIRYQSFQDKNELIAAIQKRQPHKIDIGAVFTGCPKDHNTLKPEQFTTKERELVFDIDMTDYDDIRTCCTGAAICRRCWPYMTMAIKVVDKALRDDFGFRHILWIYSGRRGVHCWVCDPQARELSNEARAAVVDYLTIHTGSSENSDKKLKQSFESPHPMVRRAYDILEPYFASCIADEAGQGLLARKDRYMKVLNTLPNEAIRRELYEKWTQNENLTGQQRWQQMKAATTAPADPTPQQIQNSKKRKVSYAELDSWRYELVFTHCYARLDANVSKTQNHLLKSAFCVHPKTGRVCVPIDPADADNFDPFTVPTVRSLCAEVDEYDRTHMDDGSSSEGAAQQASELEKTSLKDAIAVFDRTFMRDLWVTIRRNLREQQDRMRAEALDF